MLVVTLKENGRVRLKIGDLHVWVTVVDIDRGKVRVGFEAPKFVQIARNEILPEAEQRHVRRAKKS